MVCLGALFFTLWSMRACETGFAPPVTGAPQPFAGAEAGIVPLGTRACLDAAGPSLGGGPAATTPARVAQWLVDRGYVATGDAWEGPLTLPVEDAPPGLDGACGAVAYVVSGYVSAYTPPGGRPVAPCLSDLAIVPVCGGDRVRVEGSGTVQRRAFLVAGLTPDVVRASGMPLGALLAHAEAETHLRSLGWQPADDTVRVRVAPFATAMIAPPAQPTTGCVAWVATSVDLGNASTHWMGRSVDFDSASNDVTAGLLSCRADPSAAPIETTLNVYDHDGLGGELFFRPYAPAVGPVVGGAGAARSAIGLASIRVVEAAPAPADLPRSVEMNAPDE